jgi:hypothetical protein
MEQNKIEKNNKVEIFDKIETLKSSLYKLESAINLLRNGKIFDSMNKLFGVRQILNYLLKEMIKEKNNENNKN